MLGWEFPPYFAGGVGIVCHALTTALAKRNVEVTYIMPSGPREVHADHVRLIVADNIITNKRVRIAKITSLLHPYASMASYEERYATLLASLGGGRKGVLYGQNLIAEMARFAEKVRLLVQALNLEFDVIHAHDWTTFPAAITLKEATGKPLIVHVHITEFDKSGGEHANPSIYAIEKAGMDAADIIITVSNLIKNRCVHQYHADERKIRVIHNAVEFREGLAPRMRISPKDKVVLFLGRVTLQKGPDYFIEAAKKVAELEPNVKFILAGTGDMLPRMIERAAELGIGSKVIFPGFVNRQEAEQLYRMADVFVMPSVSEPFGIVPLEAMRNGVPAIISKQSGVSEVLRHALKVDFWDVNDIANKIIAALSYTTLRHELRRHGDEEVRSFNWDAVAARVENVYKELLGATAW